MAGEPGDSYLRLLARLEGVRSLGVSLGLDRVRLALARMGSPDQSFVNVQVAGTNGKGSTAAMADAILRAAGLRTGLFTSPHLCRFTERIRIDGEEVDGDALAALDPAVVATGVPLTYFEVSAVLALAAFARARVDVAVLETGLGGRLDATTAVDAAATAITTVGFDHMDLLGDTLAAIAREKAGVARPGVPLYLGRLPPEADAEVVRVAAAVGAPVRRIGVDFTAPEGPLALAGEHQRANAALAVALAGEAARACRCPVTPEAVAAGLGHAVWPGRLEWVAPDVLVDCAHNPEAARALADALPARRPRALVTSIVRGKDVAGILGALAPSFDRVVATRSHNPRALPPEEVAAVVPGAVIAPDAAAALARAREGGGVVVVAGSIFLVGEVRALVRGERCDPAGGGDPLP